MHNVLSYQTAMRVNSGGEIDVRQFVTKRSCVSIVMSVAFLTLVSGFIFGKYDSHRHQQNRAQYQPKNLQQELYSIKATLAASALLAMGGNKTIDDTSLMNEQVYTNLRTCLDVNDNYDYKGPLDLFIVKLIDDEINSTLNCFQKMDSFLKKQYRL